MTLRLAPALSKQHQQAVQLIQQRRFKEAHAVLAQLLEHQPEHADSYFLLGVINLEYGQLQKSIRLMEKATSLQPKDEYLAHLAKGYSLTGALEKAKAIALSLPASQIQQALTLDTLGVALSRAGLHQLAYFWQQQKLPNFRLQSYEELVHHPEQQISELLQFCQLDWQEACLNSEQNQAPVSTASKVQVREAINTKSVGRWQKYQPMLEPLLQQLKAAGIDC